MYVYKLWCCAAWQLCMHLARHSRCVCVYLKDLYLFIIYMVLDSLAIEQACRKAKQVCVCFCF